MWFIGDSVGTQNRFDAQKLLWRQLTGLRKLPHRRGPRWKRGRFTFPREGLHMLLAPPRIHPTAIVDAEAELAAGVVVGPFAIIEGPVRLGPGCTVRARAHLIGSITA